MKPAAAALFVLLPATHGLDALLAALPEDHRARVARLTLRRYPRADDARHLQSLVRGGRDPLATRWWRGALLAVAAGASLGGLVNGLLAGVFGMLGGLLEIAIPLGLGLGAFLGGFTAAMTGTESPRDELRALWPLVRPGDTLLQWSGVDRDSLIALDALCRANGMATARCT